MDYEKNVLSFTSVGRMAEIANDALDAFSEMLKGRSLYYVLSDALKMSDEEILAAGFTTLAEFMQKDEKYE